MADIGLLGRTPRYQPAEIGAAERRVEAAFPERGFLLVQITERPDGSLYASAGKAARMRCLVQRAPDLETAVARLIAKIAAN